MKKLYIAPECQLLQSNLHEYCDIDSASDIGYGLSLADIDDELE